MMGGETSGTARITKRERRATACRMSGTRMGRVTPFQRAPGRRIPPKWSPSASPVPRRVEIAVDTPETTRVFRTARPRSGFVSTRPYQSQVNPSQARAKRESLKE